MDQAEADHDQVEKERECQAANLRKHDKHAEADFDQFFKDQETLREIKNDEQKVLAAQLRAVAGSIEARNDT